MKLLLENWRKYLLSEQEEEESSSDSPFEALAAAASALQKIKIPIPKIVKEMKAATGGSDVEGNQCEWCVLPDELIITKLPLFIKDAFEEATKEIDVASEALKKFMEDIEKLGIHMGELDDEVEFPADVAGISHLKEFFVFEGEDDAEAVDSTDAREPTAGLDMKVLNKKELKVSPKEPTGEVLEEVFKEILSTYEELIVYAKEIADAHGGGKNMGWPIPDIWKA
ncbi:uncharacterized protein METZ01_LOCUS464299, partial [marine metagenome]